MELKVEAVLENVAEEWIVILSSLLLILTFTVTVSCLLKCQFD